MLTFPVSHLPPVLFTLASPLISPKFFRKLIYTSTLSSLATHLPLQQLLIPAETLKCVRLSPMALRTISRSIADLSLATSYVFLERT